MKYCLLFFIFFNSFISFGQAPEWVWAKGVGEAGYPDNGDGISTDRYGNIYVTGSFTGTGICFGLDSIFNSFCGYYEIFLVKYDATGNVVWTKSEGGTQDDYAVGVATDKSGNIYMTGTFRSTFINIGSFTLYNRGSYPSVDFFLVKYDSIGNVLWAKSGGSKYSDESHSVTTDVDENIYITGMFSDTLIFGNDTIYDVGQYDYYIIKSDTNGNLLWANYSSGTGIGDNGYSTVTDFKGNVFVTGKYLSPTFSIGNDTLYNAGQDDIFLAKYDKSGNPIWSKRAGSTSSDCGNGIAVDATGNAYVTGYYQFNLIMGTDTLYNAGAHDMFLAKYDTNGNVIWAKSAGGDHDDYAQNITADSNGFLYVIGNFESSSITFGSYTLYNSYASKDDVFLVKYNSNGNVIWAKSVGGNYFDYGTSCAVNSAGNLYVTGGFNSQTIVFGNETLINSSITGNGEDIFIAKLSEDTITNINYFSNEEILNIYPNPTSGKINIMVPQNFGEIKMMEIYNCIGQLQEIPENFTDIDISAYKSGLYFLVLSNGKGEKLRAKVLKK
jgi:hypothetical protein